MGLSTAIKNKASNEFMALKSFKMQQINITIKGSSMLKYVLKF